ncbi:radical SAM protein [Dactylosporangium vinaceum]|uniref:Radical SAM protein n=1 Tax=Dactylosporangium vinaceum TaxID=53362 RepID=A0ABV5MIB4_9ACTN|nr:radical SAM protein [Dactylosporangium vinaceum]UAB97565.1 radical SAM protein [Dactylosporangium vinaceum]
MQELYPQTGVCFDHGNQAKLYMVYTLGCNAACDHCLVESSPRRREKLDLDVAKELLRVGAQFGKNFLDLGGGEIMLFPDEVYELARTAADLGYYVSINTNGFWGRTPERARAVVEELQQAGVGAIFPSASAYHLAYVSIDRLKHIRQACRDLGMVYELNWVRSHRPETDAFIQTEMELDSETIFPNSLTTAGNDAGTIEALKLVYGSSVPDDIADCGSLQLGVNPHGHVIGTCSMTNRNEKFAGTPLFIGNFHDTPFDELLRAERDSAVLQFIYRNPHPALHKRLLEDPSLGRYYQDTFGARRYYSVVDYYIDVFRDERVMAGLDEALR